MNNVLDKIIEKHVLSFPYAIQIHSALTTLSENASEIKIAKNSQSFVNKTFTHT